MTSIELRGNRTLRNASLSQKARQALTMRETAAATTYTSPNVRFRHLLDVVQLCCVLLCVAVWCAAARSTRSIFSSIFVLFLLPSLQIISAHKHLFFAVYSDRGHTEGFLSLRFAFNFNARTGQHSLPSRIDREISKYRNLL